MTNEPTQSVSTKRVVLHPVIESQEQLQDMLCRLAWYLTPALPAIEKIVIPVSCPVNETFHPGEDFDPAISEKLDQLLKHVVFEFANDAKQSTISHNNSDLVFVWDWPDEDGFVSKIKALRSKLSQGGVVNVDTLKSRNEGSLFLWAVHNHLTDSQGAKTRNHQAFQRFAAQCKIRGRSRAYVFGTGPTLSQETSHDYSDGDCIISNSMVKNIPLLERLNPIAIVAGDPIFHAGCSSYAGEFRAALIKAMRRFPMTLFVPARDEAIYAATLPSDVAMRMIAVPFGPKDVLSLDLQNNFQVNPAPNILTLLLLPIAASIHNKITVVGCDGKPSDESDYFWSHDPKTQFVSHMDAIKRVHPAFFNIDYQDYYDTHCDTLNKYIQSISATGGRVDSLTPSFIPVLQERQRTTADAMSDALFTKHRDIQIVSVDPDTVSDHGHFLSYSEAIKQACDSTNTPIVSLTNIDASPEILNGREYLRPSFTINSWSLSARLDAPDPVRMHQFSEELESAITKIESESPNKDLCLYMYCGSLSHAACISDVIRNRPRCRAVINLFWESARPEQVNKLGKPWSPFVNAISSDSRIKLTVPTHDLGDELFNRYGWDFPVAPHPSPTIQDRDIADLPKSSTAIDEAFSVLFPGSQRIEKGFQQTVEAIESLHDSTVGNLQCKFAVRYFEQHGTPKEFRDLLNRLSAYADVLDQSMDRADFQQMFHGHHAVVLPYHSDAFRWRTSGLLIDAVMSLVPVIVLADTWMASVVKQSGCGVIIDQMDADSLHNALEKLHSDYNSYVGRCKTLREEYARENSWETLTRSIASLRFQSGGVPDPVILPKQSPLSPQKLTKLLSSKSNTATKSQMPQPNLQTTPSPASTPDETPPSQNTAQLKSKTKTAQRPFPVSPGIGRLEESIPRRIFAHAKLSRLVPGPLIRRIALLGGGTLVVLAIASAGIPGTELGLGPSWLWPVLSTALLGVAVLCLLKWTVLVHGTAWSLDRRTRALEEKIYTLPSQVLDTFESNLKKQLQHTLDGPVLEIVNRITNQTANELRDELKQLSTQTESSIERSTRELSSITKQRLRVAIRELEQAIESESTSHDLTTSQLDSALQQLQKDFASGDQTTSQIETTLNQLQNDFTSHSTSGDKTTSRLDATLNQLQNDFTDTTQTSTEISNQLIELRSDLTSIDTGEIGTGGRRLVGTPYVRFDRLLTEEQANTIIEDWAPLLGVQITRDIVHYRERKLLEMESFLDGRLAGSISDLLVRCMAVEGALKNCNQDTPRFLEIGTLFGISALFIHHTLSPFYTSLDITLIDPLDGYYGNQTPDVLTGIPVSETMLRRNIRRWNAPIEQFNILVGKSESEPQIQKAHQHQYAAVFIDGDHSEQGVSNDFNLYADCVAENGCLIFDDYGQESWPAIQSFVDEFVDPDPRFTRIGVFGSTAVFKRLKDSPRKSKA